MNVQKNVINELSNHLQTDLTKDELIEKRNLLYAANSERVKLELNNLVWMNAPDGFTLEKADAISSTMLQMIFYPEIFLKEPKSL